MSTMGIFMTIFLFLCICCSIIFSNLYFTIIHAFDHIKHKVVIGDVLNN